MFKYKRRPENQKPIDKSRHLLNRQYLLIENLTFVGVCKSCLSEWRDVLFTCHKCKYKLWKRSPLTFENQIRFPQSSFPSSRIVVFKWNARKTGSKTEKPELVSSYVSGLHPHQPINERILTKILSIILVAFVKLKQFQSTLTFQYESKLCINLCIYRLSLT